MDGFTALLKKATTSYLMLWCSHVKITLALSVNDGNGAVSSFASQPRSCVGSDSRGYCAARVSGPEKSRHTKHSVLGLPTGVVGPVRELWKRGFVAFSLVRSGLDPVGTGGGTLAAPFSVGVLLGLGGILGFLFNPPNPDCRAFAILFAAEGGGSGRFGSLGLASSSSASPFAPLVSVSTPDGRRRGSRGTEGDESLADRRERILGRDGVEEDEEEDPGSFPRREESFPVNPLELNLDSERGAGVRSIGSSFGRLGGSTGSSVSPHAGALMRPLPLELTDVVDVPRPTLVAVVDWDASDKTDSCDGLCDSCVGRRGGKLGRDSCRTGICGRTGGSGRAGDSERAGGGGGGGRSDRRVGKGGGAFFGFNSGFDEGVGGGRGADLCICTSAGSLPIEVPSMTEPVTA